MSIKFITNEQLYHQAILPVSRAENFVWIGTADIKDLHVKQFHDTVSFLSMLNDLVRKKISVRLLHAKEPGPNFRSSFDKYPLLAKNIEMQLCPRVHFKHIIIDGEYAYSGSANLTGAGLGMKSANNRNFESGIVTTNPQLVDSIMSQFDSVWMGSHCVKCGRRQYCSDPIL
ncbi:MAG: phospholipase D family protein [Mangrovibacterium sp.]